MHEDQTNELREIAFRKIGRNVVNLQRFERMLKLIIVRSNVQGYTSELAKVHQRKFSDTKRKTLGPLVREFFNTLYSPDDPFSDSPADADQEIWTSFSLRIESRQDSIIKREHELRQVVEERNLLIHHWLAELDFNSAESCQKLISQLDEQNDRLTPHFDSLMRLIGDLNAAERAMFELLEAGLRESLGEQGDQ
jgi:hypothetical protein